MEALKQIDYIQTDLIQTEWQRDWDVEMLLPIYFESKDRDLFWHLCTMPTELVAWSYKHFNPLPLNHKYKFCRLLFHNRNLSIVSGLIHKLLEHNQDESTINALTPKPWVLKQKEITYTYQYDRTGKATSDVSGLHFQLGPSFEIIQGEYSKDMGMTKKLWRREYRLCVREYNKRITNLFKMMLRTQHITYEEFIKMLEDGFFFHISHSLVFAIYQGERQVDLCVMHDGVLQDMQNKNIDTNTLKDKSITIVHSKNIPLKYDFLRHSDFVQPFEQLKRAYYSRLPLDSSTGAVTRYVGTRINKSQMRLNAKGFSNIRISTDSIYARFDQYVARYIFSNIDEEGNATLLNIVFYKSQDMVYHGLFPLFEKSKQCEPNQVTSSLFSEFLRVVGGENS